ncbi:MAG: glycosyltransferase, partial [Anaerolineae bacterium]|nr:glycosyltransferase [Anaerolineae bacterium]
YAGQIPVVYVPNGWGQEATTGRLARESGFDFDRVAAVRRLWQLDEAPLILLYSRFLEFRLERIVNLVKEVAAHMPEARWLMVGQGLRGEEAKLRTLLTQAKLIEFVRFTGWPVEDLAAHFQAAAVAIYPYDDTLINRTKCSVKLIDLLAAGLPVVADAVGQNCEYIQAGVSGILVPPENDTAFSEAIVALLRSPETRRRLGEKAARQIKENFSWSYLSQRIEKVYT